MISANEPIFPEPTASLAEEKNTAESRSLRKSRAAEATTLEPPVPKASRSTRERRKKDEKPWDENLVLSPIKPTIPSVSTSTSTATETAPKPASSRKKTLMEPPPLPKPREAPAQPSPLTMDKITAKLAATEREADAARVRAKLRALKAARGANLASTSTSASASAAASTSSTKENAVEGHGEEEVAISGRRSVMVPTKTGDEPARKRDKVQRSSRTRRRSTLSPWELESLILGGVQPSPAKKD